MTQMEMETQLQAEAKLFLFQKEFRMISLTRYVKTNNFGINFCCRTDYQYRQDMQYLKKTNKMETFFSLTKLYFEIFFKILYNNNIL